MEVCGLNELNPAAEAGLLPSAAGPQKRGCKGHCRNKQECKRNAHHLAWGGGHTWGAGCRAAVRLIQGALHADALVAAAALRLHVTGRRAAGGLGGGTGRGCAACRRYVDGRVAGGRWLGEWHGVGCRHCRRLAGGAGGLQRRKLLHRDRHWGTLPQLHWPHGNLLAARRLQNEGAADVFGFGRVSLKA